ncbi:MAG: ATP-binding protein [Flavobacteriales bacterium]|nr:ATP-binding protein [Flavobacteriales bacterium]
MEKLFVVSERKLERTNMDFVRYLMPDVEWNLPLIILKGPRGSGKSTMLLQRAVNLTRQGKKVLYCTLDHPYFEANRLYDVAEQLSKQGIHHLFVDEVHKYSHWSKDLKAIYDTLPDMRIVASGSSILDIIHGEADLSRRAASYYLAGLSFREFLSFKGILDVKSVSLSDILDRHAKIAIGISDQTDILKHFRTYLRSGYYPFFKESLVQYPTRLLQTVNTVMENDIPAYENVGYQTVRNLKKLLYYLANGVPYTPNITKLAGKVGTTRPQLLKMLDYMERGDIILQLRSAAKGVSKMAKPEKIFLHNTNLSYLMANETPNIGQLRENFFFNQLKVNHEVTAPRFGDFMIDGTFVFEIGGPSKKMTQVAGVPNAFVVADGIKAGSGKHIPLWLFGMMY